MFCEEAPENSDLELAESRLEVLECASSVPSNLNPASRTTECTMGSRLAYY